MTKGTAIPVAVQQGRMAVAPVREDERPNPGATPAVVPRGPCWSNLHLGANVGDARAPPLETLLKAHTIHWKLTHATLPMQPPCCIDACPPPVPFIYILVFAALREVGTLFTETLSPARNDTADRRSAPAAKNTPKLAPMSEFPLRGGIMRVRTHRPISRKSTK